MTNLKQYIISILSPYKRQIIIVALLGIVISNIAQGVRYVDIRMELDRTRAEREFFLANYEESRRINRELREINDRIQVEYYQLAEQHYCINSIEDWEKGEQ